MHVLHVIPTLDHATGGPSLALRGLAVALQRAGAAVTIAVASVDPRDLALVEEAEAAGVRVRVGRGRRGNGLDLRREVEAARVGHIHALWEPIQHRAAVLCRRLGRPHVFRPCGMLDPWSLARSRWKKRLYLAWRLRRDLNGCSAIHFTTPIERDLTAPLGLRPPAIVEPSGIDLDEFGPLPPRGTFRGAHAIPAERPVVLFMSRLHPKKGLDLLIPAFAALDGPQAHLVIAGEGEDGLRERLAALVRQRGLGGRVTFAGLLRGRERIAALADADLFVLPSYQENFGLAVVESLAAGTPVIVSDQVNLHPEITAAGVGGVVRTDVAELAAEMRRWLDDEPGRRQAGERARALVRARFDWNVIAGRWLAHYDALCARQETWGHS